MQTTENQQQEHLGTGLSFPLKLNAQGQMKLSTQAQKVKESILIILNTQIGERVYRPTFGCGLSKLTFAALNNNTMLQIRWCIREALETWEPRIIVDNVWTEAEPVRGRIDIIINYRLKNYPDPYSLVYPFYLDYQPQQYGI